MKRLLSTFRIGMALFMAMFGTNLLPVATAYAAPGNNGTIKIDGGEVKDDEGDNGNEPHVGCGFNVSFYGYDAGARTATVQFEAQSPTGANQLVSPTGVQNVNFTGHGPGDTLDHTEPYTLSFQGAPQPQQGYHVKVTVEADGSHGNDTKSKVFWVEGCEPTPATPSVSAQPTACSEKQGATGAASVAVTNTDDNTNESVTYTVSVGGAANQIVTVADGDTSGMLTFEDLPAGMHAVSVSGDDGTQTSATVSIADCEMPSPNNPQVDALVEPCTENTDSTDDTKVTVTNTDDATDKDVVYTASVRNADTNVEVDSFTFPSLADGDSDNHTFTGLAKGDYYVVITGDDQTTDTSDTLTVNECEKINRGEPDLSFDYDETCSEEGKSEGEASVEIDNEGNGAANDLAVILKDSNDNVLDTDTDVDVAANDETEVNFTGLDTGRYTIEVWDGDTLLNSDEVEVDKCGQVGGINDVCPNIDLSQRTVPAGMFKDAQGNCVTDVCPNLPGGQKTVPAGSVKVNGDCVTITSGGEGGGHTLGTSTLPGALPATGGTSVPNPLISLVAAFLTYLFLYRRNKKAEA